MKRNKTVIAFFISICFVFIVSAYSCKPAQVNTVIEDEFTSFMQPYVDNREFDGYILIEKSDSILLSRGFGKDANQLTENSQFMLGSITKTLPTQ